MSTRLEKELSIRDMCEGQIAFLDKVTAHSNWGHEIFVIHGGINSAMHNVRDLLKQISG